MIINNLALICNYLTNIINYNMFGGKDEKATSFFNGKILMGLGVCLFILLTIHWVYILITLVFSCVGMEWYFKIPLFLCSLFIPFFWLIVQVIIWFGKCK